jgi:transglutaminase/protease-like cytokinesis protein 3
MEYNIKHYMALQKVEIEEHKWFLSERAKRDVGETTAIYDWIKSGNAERFQRRYFNNLDYIEEWFEDNNPSDLSPELVHRLLKD